MIKVDARLQVRECNFPSRSVGLTLFVGGLFSPAWLPVQNQRCLVPESRGQPLA
jgi:hypothetical protein